MNATALARVLRLFLVVTVLLCIAGIIATFLARAREPFPFRHVASVAFVLLGIACAATRTGYGRWALGGLLCCAAGDFIGPFNFIAGLAVFLCGHLFYIAAFAAHGITARRLAAAIPLALIVTGIVLSWLYPHVPRSDVVPVLAYVSVITTMLATAIGSSKGATGRLILIAAIVFYISDIFVARWKYVELSSINGMFCYPLYYLACTGFAWTPLLHLKETASAATPEAASA